MLPWTQAYVHTAGTRAFQVKTSKAAREGKKKVCVMESEEVSDGRGRGSLLLSPGTSTASVRKRPVRLWINSSAAVSSHPTDLQTGLCSASCAGAGRRQPPGSVSAWAAVGVGLAGSGKPRCLRITFSHKRCSWHKTKFKKK